MKLGSIKQIEDLQRTVASCKGDVWLESIYGDKFSLKSKLAQYIAIGKLLNDEGNNLEMFCSDREDEQKIYALFGRNPDMIY